jgi:Fe-Mn family superoxide dismutase
MGMEWYAFHELYFENLSQTETPSGSVSAELTEKIDCSFGTFEAWSEEFFGIALMRGIGWVVLTQDEHTGRALQHLD